MSDVHAFVTHHLVTQIERSRCPAEFTDASAYGGGGGNNTGGTSATDPGNYGASKRQRAFEAAKVQKVRKRKTKRPGATLACGWTKEGAKPATQRLRLRQQLASLKAGARTAKRTG